MKTFIKLAVAGTLFAASAVAIGCSVSTAINVSMVFAAVVGIVLGIVATPLIGLIAAASIAVGGAVVAVPVAQQINQAQLQLDEFSP